MHFVCFCKDQFELHLLLFCFSTWVFEDIGVKHKGIELCGQMLVLSLLFLIDLRSFKEYDV